MQMQLFPELELQLLQLKPELLLPCGYSSHNGALAPDPAAAAAADVAGAGA